MSSTKLNIKQQLIRRCSKHYKYTCNTDNGYFFLKDFESQAMVCMARNNEHNFLFPNLHIILKDGSNCKYCSRL
jgi:hypothetical protein